MKITKKADLNYIFVAIVVTLIGFFTIIPIYINMGDVVSTSSEDKICRALIQIKDKTAYKLISEYLYDINTKCVQDRITVDKKTDSDKFQEIATQMQRCWYRYGEGEYDFLGNFETEGNWCFKCGILNFENQEKTYSFDDFRKWTQENTFEYNENEIAYSDYLNIKYTDASTDDLREIKSFLEDEEMTTEEQLKPIINFMANQYNYIQDLKLKQINTAQNVYVVYRYDRLPKEYSEVIGDTLEGVAEGAIKGFIFSVSSNLALTAFTGGVGAIKAIPSIGKSIFNLYKAEKTLSKALKLEKILEKVSRLAKFTGKSTLSSLYSVPTATGAAAQGYIEGLANDNYVQYVDLLTQEQYYRLCGTQYYKKEQ